MRIVTEPEFAARIREVLAAPEYAGAGWVTGPGRSGAIAAVYASHILHIPFVPYGKAGRILEQPLIIDTASESGATMRKAMRRYQPHDPVAAVCYQEPPRVAFWYEAPKPQRYKHERPVKPKRYVLHPGVVSSMRDGQLHRVTAKDLAKLYGVDMAECIIAGDIPAQFPPGLTHLHPMPHGDYAACPAASTLEPK